MIWGYPYLWKHPNGRFLCQFPVEILPAVKVDHPSRSSTAGPVAASHPWTGHLKVPQMEQFVGGVFGSWWVFGNSELYWNYQKCHFGVKHLIIWWLESNSWCPSISSIWINLVSPCPLWVPGKYPCAARGCCCFAWRAGVLHFGLGGGPLFKESKGSWNGTHFGVDQRMQQMFFRQFLRDDTVSLKKIWQLFGVSDI